MEKKYSFTTKRNGREIHTVSFTERNIKVVVERTLNKKTNINGNYEVSVYVNNDRRLIEGDYIFETPLKERAIELKNYLFKCF